LAARAQGPGSAAVESLGCCAGRVGCTSCWLAGSVRVSGVGGLARSHGRERVRPRGYASRGQLMAGSTSRPARLCKYRFRPAGCAVGRDTRKATSGPSPGPRVSPATRLLLPGRVRGVAGLGRSGVAASVRGVLDQLAAGGRSRATERCSPARGRRPLYLRIMRGGRPSRSAYTESHWLTLQVGCSA
jgi:hypothetical protein